MNILLPVLKAVIGWCLFWWIVGPLYFYNRIRHEDAWLIFVPLAPLMPIVFILGWLDDKKFEFREFLFTRTANKISAELQARGIKVKYLAEDKYDALNDSCVVVVEVKPEQMDEYRKVYAWAIKKFSRYTPSQLCRSAEPLILLNREWAESIGIDEYADERWSVPCEGCGEKRFWGIWWGDEASHQEKWNPAASYFKGGKWHAFEKYFCDNCRNKKLSKDPLQNKDLLGNSQVKMQ